MLLVFSSRVAECPPVWEKLFIRFTVRVFRERLSVCVCSSFLFGFKGRMWDLIVLIPDHFLSIYFKGKRANSVVPDEAAQSGPPHLDQSCLQIQPLSLYSPTSI